jgi:uncharacterized cupredoxin-like copper-binding protein
VSGLRLAALALGLALLAACGSDSPTTSSAGGARTVDVTMRDNDFDPAFIQIKAGETITFVFHNEGSADHDAFIGDLAAQDEHETESGDAAMHHGSDNYATSVKPGKTGTITRTFDEGDDLWIGCHETGHYAAGMKIKLDVS